MTLYDQEALAAMVGRKVANVTQIDDSYYGDVVQFEFADGSVAKMYHAPECCEYVYLEDVCGDFADLIGYELLVAETRESDGKQDPAVPSETESVESFTWTFYTFRSNRGTVDLRWYGYSNGYYSEEVTVKFEEGAAG